MDKLFRVIILATLVLIFSPLIQAPFSFEDEHEYLKIARSDLAMYSNIDGSDTYFHFGDYIDKYSNQGRFKPVSLALVWTAAKLSNGNPIFMRGIIMFMIIISVFLLYEILLSFGLKNSYAFLCTFLFLAGPYDEIFYRIGPSEIYAIFFLFLGLFLYSKFIKSNSGKYIYAASVSFILMSLCKESFIPLLFIGALLFYFIKNKTSLEKINARILIGVSIITGSFLLFKEATTGSYRGNILSSYAGFTFDNSIEIVVSAIPFLLIIVSTSIYYHLYKSRLLILLFIASLVFIVIQAFVYRYFHIEAPVRYLLPALLPLMFLSSYSFKCWHLNSKLTKSIYLVIVLYSMYNIKNSIINSSYFSARSQAYHQMLNGVSTLNPDKVLYLSDASTGFEFIDASTTFLSKLNHNPQNYFHTNQTAGLENNFGLEKDYLQSDLMDFMFENKSYVIIQMSPEEYADESNNKLLDHLQKKVFESNYFNVGLSNLLNFDFPKSKITYAIYYPTSEN